VGPIPDSYVESYIANKATTPGAAAQISAQKRTDKYAEMCSTYVFYPFFAWKQPVCGMRYP